MTGKDNNKRLIVSAIWSNPEKVFGCRFRQSGKYLENEKNEEYNERGKIRLWLNPEGTNITVNYNGGSKKEHTDVFTYLQDYVLNTTGFKETVIKLSNIYGVDLNLTAEEKQTLNRSALAREVVGVLLEALRNNPQGTTAKYIQETRGLSIDDHFGELSAVSIQKAKESLTVRGIKWDNDDFTALGLTEYNVKQGLTCVMPYYSNGYCIGFTLRNTNPKCEPKDRYRYTTGMERGRGYCDTLTMEQPAVVVEGQFKAISLIQAGIPNVVAMGGNTPHEKLFELLKARKITEITFVPDMEFDEQGQQKTKIIKDVVKAFKTSTIDKEPVIKSVLLELLPVEVGADLKGYKIDADKYALIHGLQSLADVVTNEPVFWWDWEIKDLLQQAYKRDEQNGGININWFRERFAEIYQRCNVGFERQAVRNHVKGKQEFELFGVTPQALLDLDEFNRSKEYNELLRDATNDLNKAIAEGSTVKVSEAVARLNETQGITTREEWKRQLDESFEDELQAIREQPDALKTKWELGYINGGFKRTSFVEYCPADISVICALSSHGKTTFLVQSALDMVRQYPNKTFVYISCEENKRQLVERFLNTYLNNIETTDNGKATNGGYCFKTGTRKKTLKAIIRGTVPPEEYETLVGYSEHYESLKKQVNLGLKRYAEDIRPHLKLIHTDATTESICENIRYYLDQCEQQGVEVGGVFIDYMQLLTTTNRNYSRHDELKDICKGLKGCAEKTEIPFVIGAQLNRKGDTEGIDAVTISNIGEGADIERIAHDIYLIWQTDKTKVDTYIKNGKFTTQGKRSERIFTQPVEFDSKNSLPRLKEGYLYVEHLKARDGKTGGWGLLKWNGESGFIGYNDTLEMSK